MSNYPIIENDNPSFEVRFKNGSVISTPDFPNEYWDSENKVIRSPAAEIVIVWEPTFIIPKKWRWRQVEKAERMIKKGIR